MQSDNIWNDLELQRIFENNVSKACILTAFKTIWKCREYFENNAFLSMRSKGIWNDFKCYIKLITRIIRSMQYTYHITHSYSDIK